MVSTCWCATARKGDPGSTHKPKRPLVRDKGAQKKRMKRFELSTLSLARRCSTTELHPHQSGRQTNTRSQYLMQTLGGFQARDLAIMHERGSLGQTEGRKLARGRPNRPPRAGYAGGAGTRGTAGEGEAALEDRGMRWHRRSPPAAGAHRQRTGGRAAIRQNNEERDAEAGEGFVPGLGRMMA